MRTHCQTIDTRWGSENHPHYSHGNTLPYTGVPFGMNYFLPQTTHEQGAWFSTPISLFFRDFVSPTSPSPWIGDYAWCLITPITGEIASSDLFRRQSSYSMKEAVFQPHYLRIFFRNVIRFKASCFQAATGCHALSSTRKADTLLSCSKGTRGLDPDRPNLPLPHSGSGPYRRYFLLLSISSGNLASRSRASLTSIKIFSHLC